MENFNAGSGCSQLIMCGWTKQPLPPAPIPTRCTWVSSTREASTPSPAPVKAPAKRGKAAPTEDRPVPQEQGEAILARVKELGASVAPALHAWCDENKVPAGDKFTDRLAGMTATQGLALQKWLAEATA